MNIQPLHKRRRTQHKRDILEKQRSRLDSLRGLGLLPVLALASCVAPFVPAPQNSVHWHGAQTVCTEVGATALLAALLCRPWHLSSLAAFGLNRHLPFVLLHLLLLWGLVSCLLAPTPFAVQGLLLLGIGVLAANVAAAQATSTRRTLFTTLLVLLPAVLMGLTGFAQVGSGRLSLAVGVLHDHMLFGAFVSFVLPLGLALWLSPVSLIWRICGQVALAVCQLALIIAQTRSAWGGEIVSLFLFGILAFQVQDFSGKRAISQPKRNVRLPSAKTKIAAVNIAAVLIAGIIFFATLPDRETLTKRVQTLTTTVTDGRDASVQWRFSAWSGAETMIQQKPILGWGIGSYARYQFPFTHVGQEEQRVQMQGPTIFDETHNSYLQVWAEMGAIGLLLWLGTFFSLIAAAVQSLRRQTRGSLEQWLLIGGVSAIAGQMADALANPAWQFGHVALPLWIVFGLTAALSGQGATAPVSEPASPGWLWRTAQVSLAFSSAAWLLTLIWRTAFVLPAPYL